MSIWYLHHYAGHPGVGMSYRPYYLAQAMKELEQEMVVFAASFHHLKSNSSKQEEKAVLEKVDGTSYCWIRAREYSGNGLGRIVNMMQFALTLLILNPTAQFDLARPKHIIVSSAHPFHIVAGWLYAKRYGATLSFEIRDIWPLSLIELLGVHRYHPLCLLIKCFEKLAYIVSDRVISVLPNALTYLKKQGVKENRYLYLPNGTLEADNSEVYVVQPEDQVVISKMKDICQSYTKVMFYGGAHGIPNNLQLLIDAMQYVPTDYALVLVGDGALKAELQKSVESYQLNNVFFLDKVSKSAVNSLIRLSDICVITAKKTPLYQYGVSMNKLFDYMLESKPVLFAIDSPNSVIEQSGGGVVLPTDDAVEIAKGMQQLIALPKDELLRMGQCGRSFVLDNHLFSVLARKLLSELNSIR